MANTLNLGNGNWATKEDSLLGYNSENNNFKPLPFDFTRASSATVVNKAGLIETVGSGEPRIDFSNDAKGALLLEPQRTNYILKSDDALSTYQSQNGDVSDASEPINGFNNSIQIEYDASGSLLYKRDFNPTIGTEYTISLFVQMNDNSEPINTVDANSGDFSLINNNSFASASDIKTERLGSTNVYRVSSTRTATSTDNKFGILKYPTQSSKGFKVTGLQLEVSYATSYIPTQGSTVTRLEDACINENLNVDYSGDYTLYLEHETLSITEYNQFQFRQETSISYIFRVGNSINVGSGLYSATNTIGFNKFALSVGSDGSYSFYKNGSLLSSGSGLNANLETIKSDAVGMSIKDIKLYNTRLSNAELQALTTI